ncbi:hypothetical protein [Neoaquamicrobium sediminum]|uniref:hypothetical protein n=1 Tax=Neoaquamicrobium sediminum TaxID=1849104 RepID=UPI00156599B8|nr:hypothetical protein [Mesorhizobium sediminum]NRC55169.1 hypothetical protein [Mesorhizobium sediminum]
MSAQAFHKRLDRVEAVAMAGDMFKLKVCENRQTGVFGSGGIIPCALAHCVCMAEKMQHMAATRGHGTFIVFDSDEARL